MSHEGLSQLPPELWVKVLDYCRPSLASAAAEAGIPLLANTAILDREQEAFFALRQVD